MATHGALISRRSRSDRAPVAGYGPGAGPPGGVYAGEEGKEADYARSLPPFLLDRVLRPHLLRGGRAVVIAEEWHTVGALLHLEALLRAEGLRSRVRIDWNANNVFGFERIDWPQLREAARITTVSRYMRQRMTGLGVGAVVLPNGLSGSCFEPPDRSAVAELRGRLRARTVLAKMARFDPDKRWLAAMELVAEMKRRGERPLLVARGGVEPHRDEVLDAARARGLRVAQRSLRHGGATGLVEALRSPGEADVLELHGHVDPAGRRVLFRAADAVLAQSGHEPFGLVGLEAMAAGGVACVGCSGEDYAVPGHNALVLHSGDPREFLGLFSALRRETGHEQELRRAGIATARRYAWSRVLERVFLPGLELPGVHPQPPPRRLPARSGRARRRLVRTA